MIFTIFTATCFVIFLIILILLRNNYDYDGWYAACSIFTLIFAVILLISAISIASREYTTMSYINKFESVKQTIKEQRNDSLSSYERVQLTTLIVNNNETLAGKQYSAKSLWWNWFYDKRILDVKPIK